MIFANTENGKLYIMEHGVKEFLERNRYMVEFLIEAMVKFKEVFKSTKIELFVVNDPEIFENEGLFAYVYTTINPKEAIVKLNELDHSWFLENVNKITRMFNYSLRWE